MNIDAAHVLSTAQDVKAASETISTNVIDLKAAGSLWSKPAYLVVRCTAKNAGSSSGLRIKVYTHTGETVTSGDVIAQRDVAIAAINANETIAVIPIQGAIKRYVGASFESLTGAATALNVDAVIVEGPADESLAAVNT